jgi:hypothetical protein
MTATLFDFPSPAIKAKKKPTKQAYTEEFLAFWQLYPPRFNSSKFLAFKAWQRLDEDEQKQATTAAPIYAASQRGKDPQYTQHAATWLNGKYFETIAVPRATVPAAPVQIDWPAALKIYRATGRWNVDFGPEPGQPHYRGPK